MSASTGSVITDIVEDKDFFRGLLMQGPVDQREDGDRRGRGGNFVCA